MHTMDIPRDQRTAVTEAGRALSAACDFFIYVHKLGDAPLTDDPERFFYEELFTNAFNDPTTDGDIAVNRIGRLPDGSPSAEGRAPVALLQVMAAIASYAVQAMKAHTAGNHALAWSFAADSMYWAGILNATRAAKAEPSALVQHARRAAMARVAADPRQREKAFAKECWNEWRLNPLKYRSKAEFARDMLQKCEHLRSTKKLEDWCREWEAEHTN